MSEKRFIGLQISLQLYEKLRELAFIKHKSISALIRFILEEYCKN